jgi:hypothetical protein
VTDNLHCTFYHKKLLSKNFLRKTTQTQKTTTQHKYEHHNTKNIGSQAIVICMNVHNDYFSSLTLIVPSVCRICKIDDLASAPAAFVLIECFRDAAIFEVFCCSSVQCLFELALGICRASVLLHLTPRRHSRRLIDKVRPPKI